MMKYYVRKKVSISTLNGIVYTGMYNYGDANSKQYIFEQEPTKKITPICTFFYTCALVMHWINRPFMRVKVDQRVLWWIGGKSATKCHVRYLINR